MSFNLFATSFRLTFCQKNKYGQHQIAVRINLDNKDIFINFV